MPFDPNTAVLAKPRFDPGTAKVAAPESDTDFILRTTPDLVTERPESYLSRRTGGLVSMRGDAGFQASPTGLLPLQVAEYVRESPELQAFGLRLGAGIPGALLGAELGAPLGPLGSLAGAALGGTTAAMGVEPVAAQITPRIETPGEQVANVAQWLIPGSGRVPTRAEQALLEAAVGAGQGQIYANTQALVDRGELATAAESAPLVLGGLGIGGVIGGLAAPARVRPEITPALPPSVLPQLAATDIRPSELDAVGMAMRSPAPTGVIPDELNAVASAMRDAGADVAARRAERQAIDASLDSAASQAKIRALGERMMGKSPQDQLAVLDQELKLQKDTLTVAEQRAWLEAKQLLKQQIDAQKALEKAAVDEQKALAQAEQAAQVAAQPPEIPKSAQILAESSEPPALANVATEIGTQTSPFALQGKLNELTAAGSQPAPVTTPLQEPAVGAGSAPDIGASVEAPVPATSSVADVSALDAASFRTWAEAQPSGFTSTAYDIGIAAIGDKKAISALKKARTAAEKEVEAVRARMRAGDAAAIDDAPSLTSKVQFFSEAIGAAENTGSAATAPEVMAAHGGTKDAIQIESPSALSLRDAPEAGGGVRQQDPINQEAAGARQEASQADVGTPARVADGAVAPSREQRLNDAGINLPPISSMSRAAKRAELGAAGVKTYNGKSLDEANPAQISAAVGKLRRGELERGAINVGALSPIAGSGVGAAYGITQGESPEERERNAVLYGSIGLGGGALAGQLLNKAISKPVRSYTSSVLKDVNQMLTPIEEKKSMFEKLTNAYGDFRYRFNTRFAPIGEAQRALYKEVGRTFTPNRYYDLEKGFERLAGAPVQAEGEVELLQNIISKLPKKDVPHLDTHLVLSRIEDRLLKTAEENTRLQDAVGIAQAELDAAIASNKSNPGVRNAGAVVTRRAELKAANDRLTEGFDRKRVGDWSVNKARQGLADLQAEIGPDAFTRLQTAGQEFQDVMRRALQIQVDSGRMDPDLMRRVLDSNDFYAPFTVLKYFEDEESFVKGGGTSRIPSSEQLAKKIIGIDDTDVRIGSPTDVAAEQVYKGYILAQKNRKLRELATLARIDTDGDYVRPLGKGMEPRKGYEAVTYFAGGEPKRMEVSRPIANALNGLDAAQTDIILDSLGKFSAVFKLGATGLSVPFNLSNALVFDPIRLATISRYGFRGPQDFLYTIYEWPRAMFSSARGNIGESFGIAPDALYEQWIKSGAASSTLARQLTPEAFSSRLPKDLKTGEIVADTNGWLGKPIKVAALMSNTLEETTKLLGLQRAMRIERLDKLTPAQREQKWAEIVTELRNYAGSPDFARAGVSMRPLNILYPFLNARWQGATADAARLNPFRQGNAADAGAAWARLGTLVAIPAAGLAYYNLSTPENEKDFLQIPKTERERYFHIPLQVDEEGKPTIIDTGKGYYFTNKDGVQIRGYYRIPKREFSGLMANTIEDFMEYAKATSPQTFGEIAANLGENFAQTMSPVSIEGDTLGKRALSAASGINPAIRLPVEVGLNTNLFTGRNIVPEGAVNASPEKQYTESTPEAYKQVAEALPDAAPEFMRSPAKLQHVTEGLTGGFSRQFATPRLSEGNPAGGSSPLLGRYYRSERVESEELLRAAKDAERGRADQRIEAQEIAGRLADVIQSKPTNEAKQKVVEDAAAAGLMTPDVQNYLKEDLLDAQRGLTYEDRVIKRSFSVAGGFRARYYIQKMTELPDAQRAQYLQDQVNKGLLSKEVMGQIAELTQQR